MRSWYTTKPCSPTEKSPISHVVYDSLWENAVADLCEQDDAVVAWARDDHLGFKVRYLWLIPQFRTGSPDSPGQWQNAGAGGEGQDSEQNRAKHAAMDVWSRAVNEQGSFGEWRFEVVFEPAKIKDTVLRPAVTTAI
jgi:type III restriction enzyme